MSRRLSLVIFAATIVFATSGSAFAQGGKTCHMEQQCHWENFKKICTYVKVCR
jgi:hypothetical protein